MLKNTLTTTAKINLKLALVAVLYLFLCQKILYMLAQEAYLSVANQFEKYPYMLDMIATDLKLTLQKIELQKQNIELALEIPKQYENKTDYNGSILKSKETIITTSQKEIINHIESLPIKISEQNESLYYLSFYYNEIIYTFNKLDEKFIKEAEIARIYSNDWCEIVDVCFKKAKLEGEASISPVYIDPYTNKHVMTISVPIKQKKIYKKEENVNNVYLLVDFNIEKYLSTYSIEVEYNKKSENITILKIVQKPLKKSYIDYFIEKTTNQINNFGIDVIVEYKTEINYNFHILISVNKIKALLMHFTVSLSLLLFFGVTFIITIPFVIKTFKRKKTVESMAVTDKLTNLYNKHIYDSDTFNFTIKEQHSIVLIDADDFKIINDNYGHSEGDKALKSIAYSMKHCFRKNDLLIRIGGDEFLAVLSVCNEINAHEIAIKLQDCVSKKSATLPYSLSISFGVADSAYYNNFEELLIAADKMLYLNKMSKKSYHNEY